MASGRLERGPSVAVAVAGRRGRAAVIWAAENLIPHAGRTLLLHVVPSPSVIPGQRGKQAGSHGGEVYERDRKALALKEILPFKKLCGAENQVEISLLDGDDPAAALLGYVAAYGIENLVLGGSSSTWFKRVLRKPDMATSCLRSAQSSCNIFVVSENKITVKMVNNSVTNAHGTGGCQALYPSSWRHRGEQSKYHHLLGWLLGSRADDWRGSLGSFKKKQPMLEKSTSQRSQLSQNEDLREAENARLELQSTLATYDEAREDLAQCGPKNGDLEKMESLRMKLEDTLATYDKACRKLIHRKLKVQKLSAEWSEEARRVKDALLREEVMKRIVAEEAMKHLEAVNEVNEAREILEKEAAGRLKAEDHVKEQASQKRKVMEAVLSIDRRYRRYSREEIAAATDDFSPEKKIGEGGYGSVYGAFLDHTPVAVKVLREGATEKMEEFMREVEVLCGLHHPNIVLLLGACPEMGCIVYEYMENGSLQDQLSRRGGGSPLPWGTRFRVLFEVARALAYLHGSSPEPVIHRDLKPGNILLDRNFVAKIGDVGLAKFMPRVAPDGETEFKETVVAGTLHYMDPEYQRTGTLRPKSDLYAFGIIALQMLTGRPPAGLAVTVENAVGGGSLAAVLDLSVPDWPLPEAEQLAEIALRCTQLRCRDRPELEADVLPVLERLSAAADACPSARGPAHFLCPILQTPMEDPYIAADGFTYEHRAIRAWLEENRTSPVTKLELPDATIIPNHSLRLAIEEWRSV